MMMNERVTELLEYLNALSQIQGAGHYVNEEIKEAVKEIRIELGLEKVKQDKLKDSRRLVFEARLKEKGYHEPTFRQSTVFEAVYGSKNTYVEIPFIHREDIAVDTAVTVLMDMRAPVKFEFESFGDYMNLMVERNA